MRGWGGGGGHYFDAPMSRKKLDYSGIDLLTFPRIYQMEWFI